MIFEAVVIIRYPQFSPPILSEAYPQRFPLLSANFFSFLNKGHWWSLPHLIQRSNFNSNLIKLSATFHIVHHIILLEILSLLFWAMCSIAFPVILGVHSQPPNPTPLLSLLSSEWLKASSSVSPPSWLSSLLDDLIQVHRTILFYLLLLLLYLFIYLFICLFIVFITLAQTSLLHSRLMCPTACLSDKY